MSCGVHGCVLSCFTCVHLVQPHGLASQAPLSMGFSRHEYWSGLPYPPPGDLRGPAGTEPASLRSPALADRFCGFLPLAPLGKPLSHGRYSHFAGGKTGSGSHFPKGTQLAKPLPSSHPPVVHSEYIWMCTSKKLSPRRGAVGGSLDPKPGISQPLSAAGRGRPWPRWAAAPPEGA